MHSKFCKVEVFSKLVALVGRSRIVNYELPCFFMLHSPLVTVIADRYAVSPPPGATINSQLLLNIVFY